MHDAGSENAGTAKIQRTVIGMASAYQREPAYPMWPQATIGAGKGVALPLNPAKDKCQGMVKHEA